MYERLKHLCAEKGITITELCEMVTNSSGNLSTWKKNYMRSDYLLKCAEILGVTTNYILTGYNDSLTENEEEMLSLFRILPEREQMRWIVRLEEALSSARDAARNVSGVAAHTARDRETVGKE